jgi:hypothetical protein
MPVDARVETPGLGWFDLELLPAAVAGACPYRIDVAARYQVPAEQFWLDWRTWVEDSARPARGRAAAWPSSATLSTVGIGMVSP